MISLRGTTVAAVLVVLIASLSHLAPSAYGLSAAPSAPSARVDVGGGRKLLSLRRGLGCPKPGCGPKNMPGGPLEQNWGMWGEDTEKAYADVKKTADDSMYKEAKKRREQEEETAQMRLEGATTFSHSAAYG